MGAKLSFISLGTGDIELLTIKALKQLQSSDIIVVPTKSKQKIHSSTHTILQQVFKEFNFKKPIYLLYSPMDYQQSTWQNQAIQILDLYPKYKYISYITLGDSAIYSSVYYILEKIKHINIDIYNNAEVIPGITSFSVASAKIKKPLALGDTCVEIVPFSNPTAPKTKVYMRPHKNQHYKIQQNGEIWSFVDLDKDSEKIEQKLPNKIKKYMTLVIDFATNQK